MLGLCMPLSSRAIAACVVAMRAAISFCVSFERERISANVAGEPLCAFAGAAASFTVTNPG